MVNYYVYYYLVIIGSHFRPEDYDPNEVMEDNMDLQRIRCVQLHQTSVTGCFWTCSRRGKWSWIDQRLSSTQTRSVNCNGAFTPNDFKALSAPGLHVKSMENIADARRGVPKIVYFEEHPVCFGCASWCEWSSVQLGACSVSLMLWCERTVCLVA